MAKPLNITDEDRQGVQVTFNVNRFEVYHAAGWLMTAADTWPDLVAQLEQNRITGALVDAAAQRARKLHQRLAIA